VFFVIYCVWNYFSFVELFRLNYLHLLKVIILGAPVELVSGILHLLLANERLKLASFVGGRGLIVTLIEVWTVILACIMVNVIVKLITLIDKRRLMWCLLEPIRLDWLHWLPITMRMVLLLLNYKLCKNLEFL